MKILSKLFFISLLLALALGMSLLEARAEKRGKNSLDDFKTLTRLNWKMNRKDIRDLFAGAISKGEITSYLKGFYEGKETVIYFEFDRKTGELVQANMGIPVGGVSKNSLFSEFNKIEQRLQKMYGVPQQKLRGKQAEAVFAGLLAYDFWTERNTEIILLIDTNEERLRQMMGAIQNEALMEEIKSWGDKRKAVIGIVFRKKGAVPK